MLRSPFGRILIAIRENERRSAFLGIPVEQHLWLSFVISCLFVSVAGTLYALLNNFVDPRGVLGIFLRRITWLVRRRGGRSRASCCSTSRRRVWPR